MEISFSDLTKHILIDLLLARIYTKISWFSDEGRRTEIHRTRLSTTARVPPTHPADGGVPARGRKRRGQRRAQLSLLLNVLTDAARSFENIVKPRGGEEVSR